MIYGLDFGTRRLAIACAESGWCAQVHLPDSGKRTVRIEDAGEQLARWLNQLPDAPWQINDIDPRFYAERPFVGRPHGNVRTAIGQALTVGGVLAQAPGEIYLVEQAEWKKAVVGSGNASKGAIAEFLERHYGALSAAAGGDQDIIDAFCISLYGRELAGPG